MKKRLKLNASTEEEAKCYFTTRTLQLLKYDVWFKYFNNYEGAVVAIYRYKNQDYQAIYILEPYRNKNLYEEIYKKTNLPIITSDECGIKDYLNYKEIPFISFILEDSEHYKLIQKYYNDRVAKRSQVFLMNHIDEGLAILHWIGASESAKRAYCLHPLLQADEDLKKNIGVLLNNDKITSEDWVNVIEYRSVANEYLSKKEIRNFNIIRLSPLKDVNDMLIADKIQNYKDFEIYHKESHERATELYNYYNNWLRELGIVECTYYDYVIKLSLTEERKIKVLRDYYDIMLKYIKKNDNFDHKQHLLFVLDYRKRRLRPHIEHLNEFSDLELRFIFNYFNIYEFVNIINFIREEKLRIILD